MKARTTNGDVHSRIDLISSSDKTKLLYSILCTFGFQFNAESSSSDI